MYHMTAILIARELSSIIGSYCIELIVLRWHGTPWKFNGDGSIYNIFGGYELFLDKDFSILKLHGILIDLLILQLYR